MSPRTQTDRVVGDEDQEKTWAQSIRAYQYGKTHLAWNPSEIAPPTFFKHYDVTRKDRDIDPILMRHRDPAVESRRQEHEEARLRAALNTAKSRQLRKEQNYDIVNHTSHLTPNEEPSVITKLVRYPDSRTSYDIVNHVPRKCAHSLVDGDSSNVTPREAVPVIEGDKKPCSHNMKRDVDILNNRYLEKHDERAAEEQRFLREKAEKEFRRTRDFNVITGTYYDESKEQDFVQSRAKLESMQGRAQQLRLPPSIRYGEGNDYDIINTQSKRSVKNPDVPARGRSKRILGREVCEEDVRQHEQRILNRPSHAYVMTNQIFTGGEGHPPPQPRARPPVPVWDRLSGPETHMRAGDASVGRPDEDDTRSGTKGGSGVEAVDNACRQNNCGRNTAHERENEAGDAVVEGDRWQEGKVRRELSDGRHAKETATTMTSTQPTIVPVLNLPMKP